MFERYRPDGWKPGQPIVEVRSSTLHALGPPTANYDQLDALFRRELEVPTDITPKVKLYGSDRSLFKALNRVDAGGGHIPYFRTMHVNAVKAQKEGGVMKPIIHEGLHLSFSVNHPVRTLGDVAVAGIPPFALVAAYHYGGTYFALFCASLTHVTSLTYTLRPAERRNEKKEKVDGVRLLTEYGNAIQFPEV